MAPRYFPLCCVVTTLLFYAAGYQGLSSLGGAPPPAAVVHTHHPQQTSLTSQLVAAAAAVPAATAAATIANNAAAKSATAPPVATAADPAAIAQDAAAARPQNLRLVLDGTVEAALKLAAPEGKPRFVLATFGNLGVRDQLANFVAYCSRVGAPHIVGAVDVGAFDLMLSLGSPVYKTPLASESYTMDGSNQHSSGSWKKFAGMRTGEVAKIVLLGYTVLHTDCDVVFLRDPSPYIMCSDADAASADWGASSKYPCAPLREADVAVSSDNMSPDRDAQGHAGYSAGGTFNTGLLLVRPTEAGRKFVGEWHKLVVSPPRGEFAALTSDQQVFNHMFRRPNEWPGVSGKHGAWLMSGRDMGLGVKLGALPLPVLADDRTHGHGGNVAAFPFEAASAAPADVAPQCVLLSTAFHQRPRLLCAGSAQAAAGQPDRCARDVQPGQPRRSRQDPAIPRGGLVVGRPSAGIWDGLASRPLGCFNTSTPLPSPPLRSFTRASISPSTTRSLRSCRQRSMVT